MTCGASQALRLGMTRVACVSTGNTSASMAAYASAAGLQPMIFIPHGNISFGKLAQALEYGAKTLQVEANFDQILALVRQLAERLGIYLLNSINPFRIEGQKTIMVEMLDQRDWSVPDWVVLPGGNLGNTSAFGKGLRELKALGLDRPAAAAGRDPGGRLGAVLRSDAFAPTARGCTPWSIRRRWPRRSRSAIRFRGPRRCTKWTVSGRGGESDRAGDCRRQGGDRALRNRLRAGVGGHAGGNPEADGGGSDARRSDVVAVLTGNVLKDPDTSIEYHIRDTGKSGGGIDSAEFWKSTCGIT